jgi:biopolymer transport protein TolR
MPRQRRLMNQINVVPYIDVMLVLLVIFMVTAPMIQTGNVNVPSAGAGTPSPGTPETMTIAMKSSGSFELQRSANAPAQAMDRARLLAVSREAVKRNAEQPIVIAADRDLRYEEVMRLLHDLRVAGAKKISLQTQVAPER